ncbi:SMP-30/gluconolactonase/LRE family protein [Salinisphaera sp. Q1T1-3]|uniref:SMP-30/gluconolactonase/LRE family protein n=1 Tax=Salinisphaera sp. Q1T1-3 TaxID=2321229 RepID=UPI000E763CF2|nr:SMP-30/gluconolactonase/LRE family protein [Salinisphaera sp. Q1T1-3]RJS91887.1 SMP-30/gluconolactonase/LRE family protein [Salinisphaera sp. Q1T1-3]
MKYALSTAVILIAACLVYGLFWPTTFHPIAWQAPPVQPLHPPARTMPAITRLAAEAGTGPETVVIGPDGALYAGYDDGTIHRISINDAGRPAHDQVIATTNGRPMGLAFGPAINASRAADEPADAPLFGSAATALYVADARRGLLAIEADGSLRVLSKAAAGTPLHFANDVVVARDGTVYFTDASSPWGPDDYTAAIMAHGGKGRLLAYDPSARTTRVLLDGLQFANGVALSDDARYLLVAETGAYRIRRYWLGGPKAGRNDIVIDGLPGFPDGISSVPGADRYWVALFAPRSMLLDFAADKPALRTLTYRLPHWLQPGPGHVGHIIAIDGAGQVQDNLVDRSEDAYAPITSVSAYADRLYLGSLTQSAIGELTTSERTP